MSLSTQLIIINICSDSLNSIDYRLLHAMGMDTYYSPKGPETSKKIKMVWDSLTNKSAGSPKVINVA